MTDKLARIEERAVASGFTAVYPPADVLALVNIAKAADYYVRRETDYVNGVVVRDLDEAMEALRAAVAVLDGDQ